MKLRNRPFLTGTLILTLSGLLTRLIGFCYKIFLSRTIGAEGIGIYQMIFPLYGVCYAFTTSGIELSISRFVSQGNNRKTDASPFSILKTGLFLSLAFSLLTSALVYQNAAFIAGQLLHEERCTQLLRLLALILPFDSCRSCICGYYYGLQKTAIPAASQLLEQLIRVGTVFLLYQQSLSQSDFLTPAHAVAGLLTGEALAMLFCSLTLLTRNSRTAFCPAVSSSYRSLSSRILKLAAPVTGNRVALSLLSSMEAALLPLTLTQYGLSKEHALSVYGTLSGMSMAFILFPSVLTNALSVMLLSYVSESQARENEEKLRHTIRQSAALCLAFGIGCMLFFLTGGRIFGTLFFKNLLAGEFICTLSFLCPFLYLNSALHSILNGLGKTFSGFLNNLLGILIRIFFILIFVPRVGIQGYLWGLLANQLLLSFLNLHALRSYLL